MVTKQQNTEYSPLWLKKHFTSLRSLGQVRGGKKSTIVSKNYTYNTNFGKRELTLWSPPYMEIDTIHHYHTQYLFTSYKG
jgi:hypothetical protein